MYLVFFFICCLPGGIVQSFSLPPPPPPLPNVPLPAKLAGGLFLFATSVKKQDKVLCQATLKMAQETLRQDALVSMELGPGLEAGGVFCSSSSTSSSGGIRQFICDFQIQGGNCWAQARVHSIQKQQQEVVQLVSLEVSNMDAALNGGSVQVKLPPIEWNDGGEGGGEGDKL